MKRVFQFLSELSRHNNREWFAENKERYQESLDQFRELTASLLDGISSFDPTLEGIDAKQSIFRIYKDVRFSRDKSPYKTHFGSWMCKGGRKSTDAGYYFHLEPGKSFLAAGVYMPPAEQLKLIRQEILYNPEAYFKVINDPVLQENFERGGMDDMLKRGPAGFPQDFKYLDELKYKHYIFSKSYSDKELSGKSAEASIIADYRSLFPLVTYLNHSMSFSGNE